MWFRSTTGLLVAVLALNPVAAVAQESAGNRAAEETCFPGLAQIAGWIEEELIEPAAGECPCFDRRDLLALADHPWDLCVDTRFVHQASSWYGPKTREGRTGFNVMVTLASPRCSVNTCLYLDRYPEEEGIGQTFRRFEDLEADEVETCLDLLTAWIVDRGGCGGTVIADQ